MSPRFAALALLAAADHARRTGAGQYIDVSQAEAASHLLAAALVADGVDGIPGRRLGNADHVLTPHGAFPAGEAGADRWVAIACHDDAWAALVATADLDPAWAAWGRDRRRREEQVIETAIAAWTAGRDPDEITAALQAAGVAAHAVQHSLEVIADPQLRHRGTPVAVHHPTHGTAWVENTQARWSRTQPGPAFAGPPVGHHTQLVLEELLGYDADRIADLVIAGAIG